MCSWIKSYFKINLSHGASKYILSYGALKKISTSYVAYFSNGDQLSAFKYPAAKQQWCCSGRRRLLCA